MLEKARNILKLVYWPDAILLREIIDYSPENRKVTGEFVCLEPPYLKNEFGCVPPEQCLRCLVQLHYVLIGFLREEEDLLLNQIDPEIFKILMSESEIALTRIDILFIKDVMSNVEFNLSLTLLNVYAVGSYLVCDTKLFGALQGNFRITIRKIWET